MTFGPSTACRSAVSMNGPGQRIPAPGVTMKTSATADLAPSETAALVQAVSRAPSVHNSQPWQLRVRGADVDLVERADVVLPWHDPEGRDRLLSCGAALANLQLAAQALSREITTSFPADADMVATVHTRPGDPPALANLARYHAIGRRRSYRREFAPEPVRAADLAEILDAADDPAVHAVTPPHGEALAEMLGFATRAFRADTAYQRELDAWTAHTFGPRALGAVDGVPEAALGDAPLPAAGLVRRTTPVPDDVRLAERLAAETLVVLCTGDDTRRAHLAAGVALQRMWLEATVHGLAGSVLTQPLHLTGFREHLADRLGLPGLPQAIFRCGNPVSTAPPSPRLPLGDLLCHDVPGGLE
ncbi:nitroreductase family protein [Amycolatopsis sp. Poz14]|uniref:Acg family FMN-binding oxidoreductase n=1 Tax=Amycolatopsis sp. Poz14 TaxID=1447705 RepID=UPI001EE7D999|nr:nitroreductase family protein [Amycolatopsis sp. Poz14]